MYIYRFLRNWVDEFFFVFMDRMGVDRPYLEDDLSYTPQV